MTASTLLYLHSSPLDTLFPFLLPHSPNSLPLQGCLSFHADTSRPHHAWATFPPGNGPPLPGSEVPWVALATTARPSTDQIRLFCSLETAPDPSVDAIETGGRLVRACVEEARTTLGWTEPKAGCTNSLWVPFLGSQQKGPARWDIWLSPEQEKEKEKAISNPPADKTEGQEHEFVVRLGDETDVEAIIASSAIPRTSEYISSILPFSSVAETRTTPPTRAAWILNHADSALGSLYTDPQYRRRGLARLVVEHRLRDTSPRQRRFCCVGQDNEASQGVWKSLGWSKAWEVCWVEVV